MSATKIVRPFLSSLLLGSTLALFSCASGPSYAEALKTMPPIPKGKGRVFVYRDTTLGAAIRPKIKIDEQPVGTSVAKGFSYSDQTPGQHVVSLVTEWKHKDTITVTTGHQVSFRTHVTMGAFVGHVIPTAVSRSEAEGEIQNCKLATD